MEDFINLPPVSEQEVIEKNLALENLWLIEHEHNILGPFLEETLKEFSHHNPDQFNYIRVCKVSDGEWHNFYDLTQFQRRKVQFIEANQVGHDNHFYYIKNGQKHGPVEFNAIVDLVEKKELKAKDLISVDMKKWIKLAQHPEFDRRNNQALPTQKPNEENFMSSNLEIIQTPINKTDEINILAGLIYLEKNKHSKNYHHHENKFIIKQQEEKTYNLKKYFENKYINYSVASLAVILTIFALWPSNKDTSMDLAENKKQTRSRSVANTESNDTNNSSQSAPAKSGTFQRVERRNPIKSNSSQNNFKYQPARIKRTVTHPRPTVPTRNVSNIDQNKHGADSYQENHDENHQEIDNRGPEEVINEVQNDLNQNEADPYPVENY